MAESWRTKQEANCPQRHKHGAQGPSGYSAWFWWAEKMAKRYRQERCPGCGLWVIWRRR